MLPLFEIADLLAVDGETETFMGSAVVVIKQVDEKNGIKVRFVFAVA